jgi:predicted lipoprotein with Yx(FWY)xxD motif
MKRIAIATAALALAVAGCGGSDDSNRADTVATADNSRVGQTILVDSKGMTLYDLSAEKNGRFICTDAECLSLWHPLVVPAGEKPEGSVGSLGTVKRPDGKQQVTYKGSPLYTFAQDRKKGDVKGDGFKDVGVWHPVAASGEQKPSTDGGGGGGGYGGY